MRFNKSKDLFLAQFDSKTDVDDIWNEDNTSPTDLDYVKQHTDYHRIADGNATGNGSPGFKTGGMDFSDAAETCRIFGYSTIADVGQFFNEFGAIE